MGSHRAPQGGDRQEILREVYEDNLRTSHGRRRTVRWSPASSRTTAQPDARTPSPSDARTPSPSDARTPAPSDARTPSPSDARAPSHLEPVKEARSGRRASWAVGLLVLVAGAVLVASIVQSPATALSPVKTRAGAPPLPTLLTAPHAPVASEDAPPSIAELYGLQLRTIVIDAGHGGRDPGAIGRDGLQEKEVTLDIARRLKARLEQRPGYRILLTRDGDETMVLRERIEFANEHDADLFVSIHINSIAVDSIAPIETYYYGTSSDDRAMRLARRENQNSGYTVAEFNELTQQLRLELKVQESMEAAHAVQAGLLDQLRRINGEVRDWGAKSGDFMVLLGVEAPSVLAEIGSISNGAEEMKLGTASYREKLALFLEEGLLNYLTQYDHDDEHTAYGIQQITDGI